ncbi:MAG: hypothetical protein AB7J32_14910 [Pseudonocardia sp.]|mgnify:CR=1 FL=1
MVYAENAAYFSSAAAGGTTGMALAALAGINLIATILVVVTALFTAMLCVRLVRRGLRTFR